MPDAPYRHHPVRPRRSISRRAAPARGRPLTHIGSRAVEFSGDKKLLYEAILWSRTAMRLLRPSPHFYAPDEQALYRRSICY
ncbi:MAG: THUMP domain-containing protein [Hymenobacter sp.]